MCAAPSGMPSTPTGPTLHLSALLNRPVVARSGQVLGRVDDVIVRLRGDDLPLVTGLVLKVSGRGLFLPADLVEDWNERQPQVRSARLDLRQFERRPGEVLLKVDVLGHRLIDVTDAVLVRASDLELTSQHGQLVLSAVDTRPPHRLFGLFKASGGHPRRDWKAFEALIGHEPSALVRGPFGRLRRLKPAQLADLLEEASREESAEILNAVHADPELEADVFEELDEDEQARLLADRSDADVAAVLARMGADDAVDALVELPQKRRQHILDLLPARQRARVFNLLGFNPESAGGLMGVEFLTAAPDTPVGAALTIVRQATGMPAEALHALHLVEPEDGRLVGVIGLINLLRADPAALLPDVADLDPVTVTPSTDVADVALLMADYNLLSLPVIDDDRRLVGLITIDDLLEAVVPDDWRRREPPAKPAPLPDARTGAEADLTGPPRAEAP